MNPIFEDVLWISVIGIVLTLGFIAWISLRLYQQSHPKADPTQSLFSQFHQLKISTPIWVRLVLYLPLGLFCLWIANQR